MLTKDETRVSFKSPPPSLLVAVSRSLKASNGTYLSSLADGDLVDTGDGSQTSLGEVLANLLFIAVLTLTSRGQVGVLNGFKSRGLLVVRGDLLDLANSRLVLGRHLDVRLAKRYKKSQPTLSLPEIENESITALTLSPLKKRIITI